MRLIIAGSRDLTLSVIQITEYIAKAGIDINSITEVVSGGATGVDSSGELWAHRGMSNISIRRFEADWATHGNAAGPIRNKEMAIYADAAVIIMKKGGSPGSKNMRAHMNRLKKPVYVFEMEE